MKIYLIGALKNPRIPEIANELRADGHDVFDDWFAAGPDADDRWRDYEKQRGHTYPEALNGLAARHVFDFDMKHLTLAEAVVLVLPAGRSGHLEAGWAKGQGKLLFVLLDSPDRWDVMYQFANGVASNLTGIKALLRHFVERQRQQQQLQQIVEDSSHAVAPEVQGKRRRPKVSDHRGGGIERSE